MQTPTKFDLSALILGFSSAALSYLGCDEEQKNPVDKKNLDIAAQNIEILALLKEKTKGNLTDEEDKLLTSVLTDLRFRFVEIEKKSKKH